MLGTLFLWGDSIVWNESEAVTDYSSFFILIWGVDYSDNTGSYWFGQSSGAPYSTHPDYSTQYNITMPLIVNSSIIGKLMAYCKDSTPAWT